MPGRSVHHSSTGTAGFAGLGLDKTLVTGVAEMGFLRPTPIQADAIPPALAGRDVLACAMTGSGKTAAFLLPILHQLLRHPRSAAHGATRALVLTPTRELATQIVDELMALAVHTPLTAAAVIGGVGLGPQEHALRSGVDVIVATPGRLLDHLTHPYAKFDRIEHLVLDEADRMLDMGFLPAIRRVLRYLPAKRQTLFFSATMPAPIRELSGSMMRDPLMINQERQSAPAGITQAVYPVGQELKSALLLALLERGQMSQALVFTRTKHRANRLWEFLDKAGVAAARIHGRRSQAQREEALDAFKTRRYRVLVATDIAARGIDIVALGHVVNFDVPASTEDYIHRVGRTARAELTGEAFTFAAPEEMDGIRAIERAIGKSLPRITLPDFDYTARPAKPLEIPLAQRLAAMRAQKSTARARAKAKEEARASGQRPATQGPATPRSTSQRPTTRRPTGQHASPTSDGAPPKPRRNRRRRGGGGGA